MFVVRYVALLALVIWVGGIFVLGLLVVPAAFGVLQTSDPQSGRLLAGAFDELLRRFHLLAYVCGSLVVVSLLVLKFAGPPPHALVPRLVLVVTMLGIAVYSGGPVARQLAAVQQQVSGPIGRLPGTDPRRAEFDRLRGTSTALMACDLLLGLVLLGWYARE